MMSATRDIRRQFDNMAKHNHPPRRRQITETADKDRTDKQADKDGDRSGEPPPAQPSHLEKMSQTSTA